MLGTELHPDQCTSVSARHCCEGTARGGHSSPTHPATPGMAAWDKESVALAEELEEVCRNGILFSFCCFSPIVSLFCHSSGFSSSFSNPAVSWHHSSTLLSSGSSALCCKVLHEASTAPRRFLRAGTTSMQAHLSIPSQVWFVPCALGVHRSTLHGSRLLVWI